MGIHFLCQVQTYGKKWLIGDTSEEEEYTRIMSTNNPTVVETVDETSNSSNCDYTQLVSVSFTNAVTECKYHTFYII